MDTTDKLIELGRLDANYANMIQEFMRLRDLSAHKSCTGTLTILIDGLLREADQHQEEADPIMYPIGIKSETKIQTVEVNGDPTSIWYTNSFSNRLQFLLTGRLAVIYPNNASVIPLCLRLDVDKLVTIQEG